MTLLLTIHRASSRPDALRTDRDQSRGERRRVGTWCSARIIHGLVGWDEQAEVAVGRRSLSRSWRQRAGLSRSKSACDGPPITCAT